MNKKYQHVFFDLDHTLWDFEQNSGITLRILYQQFQLAQKGITDFEQFRINYEQHNNLFWERFRKGQISRADLRWKRMWHTFLDFKIPDRELADAVSAAYLDLLPQQGKLMPYAIDILDFCKQSNLQIHLITNGFELTQWQKIRTSGIEHYFGQVITSEGSNSMKPRPEIFDFALQSSGAKVMNSIMIGDALEADIVGAQQYGMDQVYYNPAKIAHTEKPTFEITCLSELKTILS